METTERPVIVDAPFPWFGGKSRVASIVWERFGDVPNYVEPFFGSGAVLLHRPHIPKIETVNDKDSFICNFWRSVKDNPETVAGYADSPVNENDLHARHIWLLNQRGELTAKIEGDPHYYDAKIAGWWVWGQSCWIGSGWCAGNGPWNSVDGKMTKTDGNGVWRKRPHLGNAGIGVNRQSPHLGDAGKGVHRSSIDSLVKYMQRIAERLRNVRVCCGYWSRVVGPSVTTCHGITGVFLDPPYTADAGRCEDLYAVDCLNVGQEVYDWAIENGNNPLLRIAVCGYEGEYEFPDTWRVVHWKAASGMANTGNSKGKANKHRERIWFSPHCLRPGLMFD